MIRRFNPIFGAILIMANLLFFIPETIKVIQSSGGSWGFGILILPVILIGHLFLILGVLAIMKKHHQNKVLVWINLCGVVWFLFWIILFYFY